MTSLLGLAYWANGELDAAYRGLAEGQQHLKLAGNLLFAASSAIGLGDIRLLQGRLRDAKRVYQQALALEPAQDNPVVRPVTADLHVGLALVHHQQGDAEAAARHLQTSKKLGEQIALADWRYRWCRARAQISLDEGALDAALNMLDAAERAYYRGPLPEARPIAAIRARVWLAQGRPADAQSWAREQGLSADDELSFLREFEHLTLARILLAQFQRDGTDRFLQEAARLLERLLQAAEQGGRTGSAIEILLLQALAHRAQGHIPQALASLERAVVLAAPEGFVRLFTTEGPSLAELLKKLKAEGGKRPDYIDTLLAAFEPQVAAQLVPPVPQPLVEPLSRRELEVLHLIAQGLSNREISERLFLALDTVKGHNRRIFGKLNVQRRTEAVARARELGLV
ncbi:MAG: hypothetical protein D6768_10950 [Chloroflexi bacterium]|nr:MAG: hypothetical protein D6768_10950 [Chloroflexota bacterium]